MKARKYLVLRKSGSRAHQKSAEAVEAGRKSFVATLRLQHPSNCSLRALSSILLSVASSVWMFRASLRSVSDPFRDQICFACLARRSIVENSTRSSQLFYRTYSSGPENGHDELGAPPQPVDSSIRLTGKKPVCGGSSWA